MKLSIQHDCKHFLQWSQLIHVQLPFACDTPLEVLHSGHVPLAMCCVRESKETEAKCCASLKLHMPKSCDWHFPVVLPLGGIIQGCVACWAVAMSSSIYWSPLQGYMFSRPHQEAETQPRKAAGRVQMPCRNIQTPYIIRFSWICFQFFSI